MPVNSAQTMIRWLAARSLATAGRFGDTVVAFAENRRGETDSELTGFSTALGNLLPLLGGSSRMVTPSPTQAFGSARSQAKPTRGAESGRNGVGDGSRLIDAGSRR
jgi:hypothetical protein